MGFAEDLNAKLVCHIQDIPNNSNSISFPALSKIGLNFFLLLNFRFRHLQWNIISLPEDASTDSAQGRSDILLEIEWIKSLMTNEMYYIMMIELRNDVTWWLDIEKSEFKLHFMSSKWQNYLKCVWRHLWTNLFNHSVKIFQFVNE